MIAPSWLADGLAIAMLTVAAYCASRPVVARLMHRHTNYSADAVHTAMGVAMAGMLTARLVSTTAWVVVFAVAAGWFGIRAVRSLVGVPAHSHATGSHFRHLVSSGAMIYMLVAAPTVAAASTPSATAMTGPGGGAGARFPTVALVLCLVMIGYTVMVTDRTSRTPPASSPVRDCATDQQVLAPRTVACCQAAMNITMGYMLVTLL